MNKWKYYAERKTGLDYEPVAHVGNNKHLAYKAYNMVKKEAENSKFPSSIRIIRKQVEVIQQEDIK